VGTEHRSTGTGVPTADLLDVVEPGHREGCLLVGHYGGGNFGDELLLEVVQRSLRRAGVERASFIYRAPARYPAMHRDLGYRLIDGGRPLAVLRALLTARSVIVGGGGLWGRDATHNTLTLSLGLLVARRLLGKPVYLLGVGYYGSATRWGRLGARLAAWGATVVVARDDQSAANFRRHTGRVRRGTDLALHIRDADLPEYRAEADAIRARPAADGARTVFVGVRRFRDALDRGYWTSVERLIAEFPDRSFVLATLEPPDVDRVNRARANALASRFANVAVLDFTCNPMALFTWLHDNADRLAMIAPQYHLLVSAYLCGIPLYPMAYDDKVEQMLGDHGHRPVRSFYALDHEDLRAFVARASAVRVADSSAMRPERLYRA
jgi:polysaccharide pyruvyl transferase WcaK-like protein